MVSWKFFGHWVIQRWPSLAVPGNVKKTKALYERLCPSDRDLIEQHDRESMIEAYSAMFWTMSGLLLAFAVVRIVG